MKKAFIRMAASLLAAILFTTVPAYAVSADSAICIDGQTGRTLYEKNPDKKSLIASTTKIMTALIVCEQCNVLDRMMIPKEAVGIEGSSMYLQEGEVLTIQELLYGLMLHSGNDAAVALAIYCGGTVEGFSELMNDKAHRLGMTSSHFVNPHGLDAPEHYSTARDLAILASYAMENPIFSATVSAKTVSIGQRYLKNHNKLLWQVDGCNGVKTGYTKAAGRLLVSSTMRDGRRIIVTTIHAPDDWNDHNYLIEQAFSNYQPRSLVSKGEIVGYIEVAGGDAGEVPLVATEDFIFSMQSEETYSLSLPNIGFVYAPALRGQEAGYAHIFVNDIPIGKVRLVYGDTVNLSKEPHVPWYKKLLGGF